MRDQGRFLSGRWPFAQARGGEWRSLHDHCRHPPPTPRCKVFWAVCGAGSRYLRLGVCMWEDARLRKGEKLVAGGGDSRGACLYVSVIWNEMVGKTSRFGERYFFF